MGSGLWKILHRNFVERRKREVRRIPILLSWVNRVKRAVSKVFSEVAVREISRSRTSPNLPIEQIAFYEGVYSPLERLEDGRHHHGRREVGQLGVFHVRQGEQHVLDRHEGDLVDAAHRRRERAVYEGAVYEGIYLVEAVPRDGDAHRDRGTYQADRQEGYADRPAPPNPRRAVHTVGQGGTDDDQRGGVSQPLDLLALHVASVTKAHIQGSHRHEPKNPIPERLDQSVDQIADALQALDAQRVLYRADVAHRYGQQRLHADRRHSRDTDEPGYGPPAPGRRPTVGEQQRNVHQQSIERYPHPGDDPGRGLSTRQRVGLGLQSVDGILGAKVVQSPG